MAEELDSLAASAEYEANTTARVVNRLFIEFTSMANMLTEQKEVVQLATRYRVDPPGFAELTREERAVKFTSDPLVRRVGDLMTKLSEDLNYARIYMNNLSHDTVTASQWSETFNIVGQIYTGRAYLINALRNGSGQQFGIARLNKTASYFVTSRIDDAKGVPLGSVTVKFDAPDMARYLTGRHIALIVNRQGRVTTASSASFMLRNVSALLPQGALRASDNLESPGEPMRIEAPTNSTQVGQWLIEGRPYLIRRQPLTDAQYLLLTLAELDHLMPMRRQHLWVTGFVAAFGVVLILFSGRLIAQRAERRLKTEQDRILAISQAAERDLAIKVRERTAELAESNASLKSEMDRRQLLEEKLRQSLSSVNDALAQQRDFVAMVSHEFRGPLAVIAAAVDNLLASSAAASDSNRLRIAKIGRTVERISMLIENVLAGDRLSAGQTGFKPVEVFDLNEILQTVEAGLDEDAAKRLSFIGGHKAVIKGDRILLEIVVQNLIQNALKYSEPTTPVTVVLSTDKGVAFVKVRDQGVGVALSDRELIFMKYYRVAGQRINGSGLGLYISREIARQNGGDLNLDSSDATGSTFCLSLPLVEGVHDVSE